MCKNRLLTSAHQPSYVGLPVHHRLVLLLQQFLPFLLFLKQPTETTYKKEHVSKHRKHMQVVYCDGKRQSTYTQVKETAYKPNAQPPCHRLHSRGVAFMSKQHRGEPTCQRFLLTLNGTDFIASDAHHEKQGEGEYQ